MTTVQGDWPDRCVSLVEAATVMTRPTVFQRWSPSGFDRTNRMVIVYLWQIPNIKSGSSFGPAGRCITGACRGSPRFRADYPWTITDSRAAQSTGLPAHRGAQLCPGITYGDISTAGKRRPPRE